MVVDGELRATLDGCAAAHRRLEALVASVDDHVARRPSRLPDWTVGHVLTHLARNADSHVRMLDAALAGEAVEQYAGGWEQRTADIEAGAGRPADELRADVVGASAALEAAWDRMTPSAWAGHGLSRGSPWACEVMPFHRWREVEVHCVDLGLAYTPENWSSEYVARELPLVLDRLPDRLGAGDRAAVLAWLLGRSDQPAVTPAPWQYR